jgi:hypothetical protein
MFHREGFGDVIIGANIKRAHRVLVFRARGHHDDGQIAGFGAATKLAANLNARERWQHPIKQHDIGPRFRDTEQRFLPIRRFIHAKPLFFEVVAQQGQ